MTDDLGYVSKSVTFECRQCQRAAQMLEVDGELATVQCPVCDAKVEGPDLNEMVANLRLRYVKQVGRNIVARELRDAGMGRIPLRKVDDKVADARWPFAMVFRDHP